MKTDNRNMRKIFDSETAEYPERSMTDTVVSTLSDGLGTEFLCRNALLWIKKNAGLYTVPGGSCTAIMHRVQEAADEQSTAEECTEALEEFVARFLNNPYVFENNMKDKSRPPEITSDDIFCYFVEYNGATVPIGMIREFFGTDAANNVVGGFLGDKNREFSGILDRNYELCEKYTAGIITEKKQLRKLFFKTVAAMLLVLLAVLFVRDKLLTAIDWNGIGGLYSQTKSIFLTIGFSVGNSYGVSHNSTFCTVLVAVALLWLIAVILLMPSVAGFLKRYIIQYRKCRVLSVCDLLKKEIEKLSGKGGEREAFITENVKMLERLTIERDESICVEKYISYLNRNMPYRRRADRRKLINTFSMVILFVLMLMTCGFSSIPDKPEYMQRYNEAVRDLSMYIDSLSFYAATQYEVTAPTAVYATQEFAGPVVYELNAGVPFRVVAVDEQNSAANKIRFLTEHGFVSGWITNAPVRNYAVPPDEGVEQIGASMVEASSTGFGNTMNVADGLNHTVWAEGVEGNGVGEYIDISLSGAVPVKRLMLQTGNCFTEGHFANYSRPICVAIRLYNGGKCMTEAVVNVADVIDRQYISFNKTITADRVRFVINRVAEGAVYDMSCITDIEVYAQKQPDEKDVS